MKTHTPGNMVTWKHGNIETWKHGNIETWKLILILILLIPCISLQSPLGKYWFDATSQTQQNTKLKKFNSQIRLQLSAYITTKMIKLNPHNTNLHEFTWIYINLHKWNQPTSPCIYKQKITDDMLFFAYHYRLLGT